MMNDFLFSLLPVSALVPFLYLIHVAGCDDARGQGDDSNADYRGDDADDATDGGDGVNVAIAYRGERTGCPVEGVEEIVEQQLARCRVDILLGIEHDERRDEDVAALNMMSAVMKM